MQGSHATLEPLKNPGIGKFCLRAWSNPGISSKVTKVWKNPGIWKMKLKKNPNILSICKLDIVLNMKKQRLTWIWIKVKCRSLRIFWWLTCINTPWKSFIYSFWQDEISLENLDFSLEKVWKKPGIFSAKGSGNPVYCVQLYTVNA